MDSGGQHGRRFVLLRHTHRPHRKPYPAEAVKPDPGSSCERHSGWVGAGVGDENAESCGAVRPLRNVDLKNNNRNYRKSF